MAAVQQRGRVRPALLQAHVVTANPDDDTCTRGGSGSLAATTILASATAAAGNEGDASLQLVLWRADALSAVIELDQALRVVRADAAAGLLFGVSSKLLVKMDFKR
jgi:hypothetical protein